MDVSKIDGMLAQLRTGAAMAAGRPQQPAAVAGSKSTDFGDVLKASLDQVNNAQTAATKLARDFELGTSDVNLTDVMTSMQKANISFQATVQVRNKLVSAYHDIMNLPV